MGWRKWNRWLHRELGFLFFGMAIIYGISGIALNHGVARHWNPGIISRSDSYHLPGATSEKVRWTGRSLKRLLELTGEARELQAILFPQ